MRSFAFLLLTISLLVIAGCAQDSVTPPPTYNIDGTYDVVSTVIESDVPDLPVGELGTTTWLVSTMPTGVQIFSEGEEYIASGQRTGNTVRFALEFPGEEAMMRLTWSSPDAFSGTADYEATAGGQSATIAFSGMRLE